MKILAIKELDEREEVVESNVNVKVKEEVFEMVKRLFHMTSNKKKLYSDMSSKIKLMETRSKQLDGAETKLKEIQTKLTSDINDLKKKLSENIKLLQTSLKGGLS